MSEFVAKGDGNEDMLIVEYGDGPLWWLYVGWWPYKEDHPLFGDPNGHFFITASRGSDKFHYTSISWEARTLQELWSAVTALDEWLASSVT